MNKTISQLFAENETLRVQCAAVKSGEDWAQARQSMTGRLQALAACPCFGSVQRRQFDQALVSLRRLPT